MKKYFYITTFLSILAVIVGMILPENRNPRDFIYILIMFLMYTSIASGVLYIINRLEK